MLSFPLLFTSIVPKFSRSGPLVEGDPTFSVFPELIVSTETESR